MMTTALKVLVLAGGPDREREVSLISGAAVADALERAGHNVLICDIGPDDDGALDQFRTWGGDVVFPVLHGAWGEGGALQQVLDRRGLPYVGCAAAAARLCMDKPAAKRILDAQSLPTPAWQLIRRGQPLQVPLPVVLKATHEGSSIDLRICRDPASWQHAQADLHTRHEQLLAERYIQGIELTIGVLESDCGIPEPLPPIHIVPPGEFYDYDAKYHSDATQYRFDLGLPANLVAQLQALAVRTHQALGCRHMSRIDMMLDEQLRPWILEVNTIPGFTSHSLLPKAAAKAGVPMVALVDRLAHLAVRAKTARQAG